MIPIPGTSVAAEKREQAEPVYLMLVRKLSNAVEGNSRMMASAFVNVMRFTMLPSPRFSRRPEAMLRVIGTGGAERKPGIERDDFVGL